MPQEMTGVEVAAHLDVFPSFVRRLRLDGRLPAKRQVGITWLYSRATVEKFARTWDRKPGRARQLAAR